MHNSLMMSKTYWAAQRMDIPLLKSIVTLVLVLTLSAEAYATEASAVCPNGIILTASVELKARDFRFWENFQLSRSGTYLFGLLRAKNTSETKAIFSTADARLSIDSNEPQRAYKKTIASEIIDLTGISLSPNEAVEINVYWPAQIERNVAARSIVLSCSATGVAGAPPKSGSQRFLSASSHTTVHARIRIRRFL